MANDLDLPAIADGQADGQWQTSNDGNTALGNALADIRTVDFSGGDVTLTAGQFRSAMTFVPIGLSATRALTLPAVKRALFFVHNTDSTDAITVTKGATTVSVAAGKLAACYTDGTTDGLVGAIITPGVAAGDVVGPGSAVDSNVALFNTTTGKLIKDSGIAISTDGTLTSNSDAKLTTEKGVKTYVDGKVTGLSWKQAVRAATTTAGTLASSFANGSAIDGVTLATGDRILIKNQSSGAENGIYVVAASGAPARATDADSGAELVDASVYVSEGTSLADTQWTCTTNAPITLGSTSLAFAQAGIGGFTAASTTEVLTGTDTAKGVTADALAALWEKGADVASSGTVSLGEGGFFHITGTTTITDIDWATAKDGRCAWVIFDGILTLTHNTTTLKLPGGANITTAAGDRACFVQDASDNVICLAYQRAATLSGGVTFASAAEIRTGTEAAKATAPDQIFAAADIVTLTDAATIAVDMATFLNAKVTLAGNRTLGAPSNPKNGQSGCIEIIQDGTGTRTLAYHADWLFAGGTDPVLSTVAGTKDLLFYQVLSTGKTYANLVKAVA